MPAMDSAGAEEGENEDGEAERGEEGVSAFVWVCIVLMVVVALYLRKWGVCCIKGVGCGVF